MTGPPGGAWAGQPQQPQSQGQSGLAIGSLVTGIIGLLTSWCCIGLILGIVAIVLGAIGRKQSAQRGASTGMATAGLALGIVAVVIYIAITVIIITTGDWNWNYTET